MDGGSTSNKRVNSFRDLHLITVFLGIFKYHMYTKILVFFPNPWV